MITGLDSFIPRPDRIRLLVSERGLGVLVPHDLRHTAASLAISAGASVKAVQRMLGQSSAQVTLDGYSHLFDDVLETLAARF